MDTSGLKWGKDEAAQANVKAAVKGAVKKAHEEWSEKIKSVSAKARTGSDAAWGAAPTLHDLGLTAPDIDQYLRALGERHGVKLGDLAQPMRLCVTGRLVSAGLFELLVLLPWDVVGPRLQKVESL